MSLKSIEILLYIAIFVILLIAIFAIVLDKKARKDGKERKKSNQFSIAGISCAGIALLINPFGLFGAIAVICGSIGLNQAKEDGTDKSNGICAILVGIFETLYFIYAYTKLL